MTNLELRKKLATRNGLTLWQNPNVQATQYIAPVTTDNCKMAYLHVFESDQGMNDLDEAAVKMASDFLALQLQKQNMYTPCSSKEGLFAALLKSGDVNLQKISDFTRLMEYPSETYFYVRRLPSLTRLTN